MSAVTLSDLRELLLAFDGVIEAEIEGEAPACLRVQVSHEEVRDEVKIYCEFLDWTNVQLTGPRTLLLVDSD